MCHLAAVRRPVRSLRSKRINKRRDVIMRVKRRQSQEKSGKMKMLIARNDFEEV